MIKGCPGSLRGLSWQGCNLYAASRTIHVRRKWTATCITRGQCLTVFSRLSLPSAFILIPSLLKSFRLRTKLLSRLLVLASPLLRPYEAQNSFSLTQMRCNITAIFRATATTAFRIPFFFISFRPQLLSLLAFCTRLNKACAASYSITRHSWGPIFEIRPWRFTSPDAYCFGVNPMYAPTVDDR